jgi:tetratricopeptide (TPR) repeat protein
LIDALHEERKLLAENYERPGTDVPMMYGEIALAIAGRLHVRLTADEEKRFVKARKVDPEAYTACLQGMAHWYKLTPADLDAAQGYFDSALKEDPNYALAHTGMGLVLVGRAQMGLIPPREARERARTFLTRALELDDTLPEAQFAMATVKTWLEWDFVGGEAAFLRTIKLKPNYDMARVYYSNLLCILKRSEEAAAQGERALELDPFNSLFMGIYANSMNFLGRYDDAVVQGRKALRTSPNDPIGHMVLWEALHLKGQYDEALEEAKGSYAALDLTPVVEAISKGTETGGYRGAMRAAGETLAAIFQEGTYFAPFFIAYPYAAAGETEKALEWLEKGIEVRDQNMPYILPDHSILQEALGSDPRFHDLMRRVKPESAGKK